MIGIIEDVMIQHESVYFIEIIIFEIEATSPLEVLTKLKIQHQINDMLVSSCHLSEFVTTSAKEIRAP